MAASLPPTKSDSLSQDELVQVLQVEIYDREGKTTTLKQLTDGQRSVLIFTRHFWCINCQKYVEAISKSIPPKNLPPNTQILIISNGSYQPIDTYAATTSSAYPIYTDPTLQLHKLLKFSSLLKEEGAGEQKKDYMLEAGSTMSRAWGGFKYALGHLGHTSYIGPKSLNGGELIISEDGKCEYIYRMKNTVDHTNVADLAKMIGAKYVEPDLPDKKAETGETDTKQPNVA